jgi:hypothetical protein
MIAPPKHHELTTATTARTKTTDSQDALIPLEDLVNDAAIVPISILDAHLTPRLCSTLDKKQGILSPMPILNQSEKSFESPPQATSNHCSEC